jgi:tRNA uridine 5-carboxymethylaminomethyl modification enzyme
VVLGRDQAYIGVLIDDLIHKGTDEPYRMFTSRAEYRILLRQDNADLRLTPLAYTIGAIDEERFSRTQTKALQVEELKKLLGQISVSPEEVNSLLETKSQNPLTQKTKSLQVLLRPDISLVELATTVPALAERLAEVGPEVAEQTEIQLKYAGYIEKEQEIVAKMRHLDQLPLPESLNYGNVTALSNEARQKLGQLKPRSLGEASRISGVSPADISVLMVYIGR